MIHSAKDKILLANRNLKIMMFITTVPFFFLLFCFKYTIKFSVLYLLYNKTKDKGAKSDEAKAIVGVSTEGQPKSSGRTSTPMQ